MRPRLALALLVLVVPVFNAPSAAADDLAPPGRGSIAMPVGDLLVVPRDVRAFVAALEMRR